MHTQQSQNVNVAAAFDGAALFYRRQQLTFIVAAGIHAKEQPRIIPVEPSSVVSPPTLQTTVPAATSLPPDWVIQRESGGDYEAFNAGGCGGNHCYGKYQFSGEWAGKLGLPEDLSTATPEQQDAAARELWANGAGCSHWSAC